MRNNDLRILITYFEGGKITAVIHDRLKLRFGGDINSRDGRPFHHFIGLRIAPDGMQGYSCMVRPPAQTFAGTN